MPTKHLQLLHDLRQSFPQPVSDPVHDGYVAFSVLRALDQVDKLKSQAPILGTPTPPDYIGARQSRLDDSSQSIEMVVPQLVEYLEGMFNWGHPRNQVNVVPPPSLASIIGVLLASMYNPNLCSDENARRFSEAEVRVASIAADLIGYEPATSQGLFTFGGTGTLLYAARVGLEKASPGSLQSGLHDEVVILGSDVSHYACYTIAAWLGIGHDNFVSVPSQPDNSVDVASLEAAARRALTAGKRIALIVATMGSTDAFGIDDLAAIVSMRDRLVEEFNLPYHPHIHADAVIGWAWAVFNGYSYDENRLEFRGRTVRALAAAEHRIRHLYLADSLGIDFHKTGYTPYVSSLLLLKDGADLALITRSRQTMPYLFQSGEWHPGMYTLETSRSAFGPMAALANLLLLGRDGMQVLIGHIVDMAEALRERIGARAHLTVLNSKNVGPVTLFRAYPDAIDTFTIKDRELNDPDVGDLVRQQNEFNRTIFERVSAAALRGEGVAIGLTDSYRQSASGEPIVALKSYILSPFCDATEIDAVVEQVSATRDAVVAGSGTAN